jgi:peptide/nickel transport system substrate-binding protein
VIPIIADEATRVAAMRTGKIDMYQLAPQRLLSQFQSMDDDLQIVNVMRGGSTGLHMRMDQGPTADLQVRRALSMAIDRQALIDAFSEGVAMTFFHPLMPADGPDLYTELEDTPLELQEVYEYNPEKAKELLAAAGYPSGFKTTITIASEGLSVDYNSMVAEMWAAVGVEAELIPLEYATRLARGFDREYDNITTGHGARPQVFNDSTRDHPWNMSVLDDDYYEEQWQLARTETDTATRNAILKDLFVYLKMLVPWIDYPSGAEFSAWWPRVQNYNGEVSFGFHKYTYFAYIWLDD